MAISFLPSGRPSRAYVALQVLIGAAALVALHQTLAAGAGRGRSRAFLRRGGARGPKAVPRSTDALTLERATFRTSGGNASCVVVGCGSAGAPGLEHFWRHYRRSGYVAMVTTFARVRHRGRPASPQWCRVPAVLRAQRRFLRARVVYADLDTLVDVRRWCGLPVGPAAPIAMNSLFRDRRWAGPDFDTHGTMVQSNAFVAMPGPRGLEAVKRWESNYYGGTYQDQGAIHRREGELCGVPGWIACVRNPEQQRCHCMGIASRTVKDECIKILFEGKKENCPLSKAIGERRRRRP